MVTLKQILEKNPEYADLPIVVIDNNGYISYVSNHDDHLGAATYYGGKDYDEEEDVLVFSAV